MLSAARESSQKDGFSMRDMPCAKSEAATVRIMTLFDAGALIDPSTFEEFTAFIIYPLCDLLWLFFISPYQEVGSVSIERLSEPEQFLHL